MTDTNTPTRAWTPGPWTTHDANEGTDYFPMWCVANEAFHNPPSDEDEPWIAIELHVGHKPDADLVALAPEMAEAILGMEGAILNHPHPDGPEDATDKMLIVAEKLRAIGTTDD